MEKWKRFERLTAALHVLQMRGATVTWNDHIEGYQIDGSVWFPMGPYTYLHIVECKDHGRPISRDEIATFAVKIEETQANKGTFVSPVGFQSGARELAKSRGIETFTLEEIPDDWPEKVIATIPPFLGLRHVRVRSRGTQNWIEVSEKFGASFMSQARFEGRNNHVLTVDQAYQDLIPPDWRERTGVWTIQVELKGQWVVRFRQLSPIPVDAIQVDLETFSKPVSLIVNQPPELRPSKLVYRDVQTDIAHEIPSKALPFGFDATLQPGKFYVDVDGRDYYCAAINDGFVDLVLLASQQFSKRMWVQFRAAVADAQGRYAEITDPKILARVQGAYREWQTAQEKGLTLSHGFFKNSANGTLIFRDGIFDSNNETPSPNALWTRKTSVELEIQLPSGEQMILSILDDQPSDYRPMVARGLGQISFVPRVKSGSSTTVVVNVFDFERTEQRMCRVEIPIGGDFVKTPSSPAFGVRVRNLVVSSIV